MGLFSWKKSRAPPPVPVDTRPALLSSPPPPPQYHASQTSGTTGPGALSSHPQSQSPPRWHGAPPARPDPPAYQQQPSQPHQPSVVVNQHYYLLPAPPSSNAAQGPAGGSCALTRMVVGSAIDLTNQVIPGVLPAFLDNSHASATECGSRRLGFGDPSMDRIYERFDDVLTCIDRERYTGNESELFLCQPDAGSSTTQVATRGQIDGRPKKNQSSGKKGRDHPKCQTTAVAAGILSGNYFAKVELYANSRLPMNLPPLKLYIPTWPLLCLAAEYSERVYERSRGKERDVYVDVGLRTGTKSMVIKSVPIAHMNTIVFAIRGTATFMDWTVNLNTEPASPAGFLDDCGNYCHAGFLSVARHMIKPVAARLRQLLQEDPGRRSYSLLITGHSAGGAVASLLYAHMLSTSHAAQSELNSLTSRFKRVHCVTFGTPPVSLLPLQKPPAEGRPELKKSLFLTFVNEGDPVARADKAYVRSLLELFATPVPALAMKTMASMALDKSKSSSALLLPDAGPKRKKSKNSLVSVRSAKGPKGPKANGNGNNREAAAAAAPLTGPIWKVPPSAFSNAGRIVILRSGDPKARLKGKKTVEERLNEGVVAQIATDEQLRTVVWGDPVCHLMKLYAGRLEILAINAVTAKGY